MRPEVPHETEAETKTSYCETETETETKKVVSRPRWSRDLNIPGKFYILYCSNNYFFGITTVFYITLPV